jgi:hypothetical protein
VVLHPRSEEVPNRCRRVVAIEEQDKGSGNPGVILILYFRTRCDISVICDCIVFELDPDFHRDDKSADLKGRCTCFFSRCKHHLTKRPNSAILFLIHLLEVVSTHPGCRGCNGGPSPPCCCR